MIHTVYGFSTETTQCIYNTTQLHRPVSHNRTTYAHMQPTRIPFEKSAAEAITTSSKTERSVVRYR